jgi:hypothetical protein
MPKILFLVTTPEGSNITVAETPEAATAKVAAAKGGDAEAFSVRPIAELEAVE